MPASGVAGSGRANRLPAHSQYVPGVSANGCHRCATVFRSRAPWLRLRGSVRTLPDREHRASMIFPAPPNRRGAIRPAAGGRQPDRNSNRREAAAEEVPSHFAGIATLPAAQVRLISPTFLSAGAGGWLDTPARLSQSSFAGRSAERRRFLTARAAGGIRPGRLSRERLEGRPARVRLRRRRLQRGCASTIWRAHC